MLRLFFVIASASCLLAGDALAQVTLKRKYEEGTTYKTQEVQQVDQTLKLNGIAIPTKSETTIVAATTYGKRDADGNLPMETKIDSLKVNLSLQGTNVTFDSAEPDKKASNPLLEPALEQFRKLSGLVITQKMSKDNKKIVSIERSKQDVELDPEDLKQQKQQEIDMIPSDPLKIGDKWQRTIKQDLGQGQVFTFDRKFEYAGPVDEFATVPGSRKLDKVTASDASVEYSTRPNAGMGLAVKKSDLKIESSKHTYLFDREAGRIVKADNEVHITGGLSISINNMDFDGDLDLTLATHAQEVK
ncbi:MAG TPA: hypothetical protein VFI31_25820 [Pirellulales bacterium]|nr:hypothetical protein [Pirellulales bacterium]